MSICFDARSQFAEEIFILADTSINKKYCVTVTRKDSSDSQGIWKYMLILNCNSSNPDSLIFARAITHDIAPPVFFWSLDETKLIYEDGEGVGNERRQIKIFDLNKRKVIFLIDGIINISFEQKENYFDSANNILIYLTFEKGKEVNIMTIDISSQNIKKVKTVLTSGDPYEIAWISKIDKVNRVIKVQYQGEDYKGSSIDLKY